MNVFRLFRITAEMAVPYCRRERERGGGGCVYKNPPFGTVVSQVRDIPLAFGRKAYSTMPTALTRIQAVPTPPPAVEERPTGVTVSENRCFVFLFSFFFFLFPVQQYSSTARPRCAPMAPRSLCMHALESRAGEDQPGKRLPEACTVSVASPSSVRAFFRDLLLASCAGVSRSSQRNNP